MNEYQRRQAVGRQLQGKTEDEIGTMAYPQYLRLETKAGGVTCTEREFIRACHSVLTARGRSRARRAVRHAWLRVGLQHLDNSRALFGLVARGGF